MKLKNILTEVRNLFLPSEKIEDSKEKWNNFASENPLYYVMTDYGADISEEKFRETGQKDFLEFFESDEILQSKMPWNEKSILEIGCGAGRISEFLASVSKTFTGLDISEGMIEKAKQRVKSENAKFISTNGTKYPIPDNSIDIVFSFITFQHMPDRNTVFENVSEVSRSLKAGGVAKIQFRGAPASKSSQFYGPSFTRGDVDSIAKKTGLKVLKTEGEGKRYFWVWFEKNYITQTLE